MLMEIDEKEFVKFCDNNKLEDISKKFGISISTVKRRIKSLGIERKKDYIQWQRVESSKKGGESFARKILEGEIDMREHPVYNKITEIPKTKICSKCKKEKEIKDFWKLKNDNEFRYQSCCKKCMNENSVKKQGENKKKLVELHGGKCAKCENAFPYYVYDFHHLNPKEKAFEISDRPNASFASLLEESMKCIMLCSNCHRIEHYETNTEQLD